MAGWLNLPNFFTLLRLALAPFVIQATVSGAHGRALALFIAAGFTDLLDGAAARRFGTATAAGAYLDPIADKCLLSGVFVALATMGAAPWWFVWLVLGRDVYILAGSIFFLIFTRVRKFPPSQWGKASTFFQIGSAVAWMVRNAAPSPALDRTAITLLWLSATLTVASGIDYTARGIRMLRTD
jgi:cardiolipin synthase